MNITKYSLAILVGDDETLEPGSVGGPGPEVSVGPIAVVAERGEQQRILVNRVHVAAHLVVEHVQLAQVLALVLLVLLRSDWPMKVHASSFGASFVSADTSDFLANPHNIDESRGS